jgi:predicted nucleic acid-binding Zn ribbon protein
MIPFQEALVAALRRLGADDPAAMIRLAAEWGELAGPPWDAQARPSHLGDGVLYVEAATPAAVPFLRYGSDQLARRLSERLATVIERVEVTAPNRHRRRR